MSKKVLIFDDDIDILEVCTIALKSAGFEVEGLTNCDNVLDKLDKHQPDVVLLDNKIPATGGIVASQTIKSSQHHKTIPVIFFSASSNVEKLASEALADFYIEKPFDLTTLIDAVKKASR
ncbi:response regulator [Danxiaibacter flavus]|uniref:Response regulator n=1 Tax=Danxiaibacter flavus TaxID=3049108 RepID=A0ABV3ZE16_9BACT|nr:response regulator [Chitinophagaceae bacterium DXS]